MSPDTLFLYRAGMKQAYRFPFFSLRLEGEPSLLGVLEEPFTQLCCRRDGGERTDPLTFDLLPGRAPLAGETDPFSWAPLFPEDPQRLQVDRERGAFLAAAGASRALVRPERAEATLQLDPEDYTDLPHWERRGLLVDTLLALLSLHPCYTLHGALLARGGEGLVVTGAPGAGKTTLALALVADGWNLMTDDNLLFRPLREAAMGSGLRRLIYVKEDTRERFASLIARRTGLFNRQGTKEAIELENPEGGDPSRLEVPIRKVLFLERTDREETTWRPLLARDAVPLLWRQAFALQAGGEGRPWFQALTELARTSALVRVEGGGDLPGDRSTAERIIADIDRQGGKG